MLIVTGMPRSCTTRMMAFLQMMSQEGVEPHKMTSMEQTLFECKIGVDYPPPIVDHKTRYQFARDTMHSLKKLPQTREASMAVYQKHGSRKTPIRRT